MSRVDPSTIIHSINTLKDACMGLADSVQRNILDDPNMPPLEALKKAQKIQKKLTSLLSKMEKSTAHILRQLQEGDPAKMTEYTKKMQTILKDFFREMRREVSDKDAPPPPPQGDRMKQLFGEHPLTKRRTKKGGRHHTKKNKRQATKKPTRRRRRRHR